MKIIMTALAVLLFLNCNDKSAPTEPIKGFDLEKYLSFAHFVIPTSSMN